MLAAAQVTLDETGLELLRAVLSVYRSVELERNALAHGSFGVCDDVTDGILWIEAKDSARWHISMWNKNDRNEPYGTEEHAKLAGKMFVYTKRDLENVHQGISALWKIIFDYIGYLRRPMQPMTSETQDQMYSRICDEPRIRDALRRLRVPAGN